MTPFLNDKKSTQDVKGFLKPHTSNKVIGEVPKDRKGTAGTPQNRSLPIRGGR